MTALMAEQDSSTNLSLSSIQSTLVSTLSSQTTIMVKKVVIPKTWELDSPLGFLVTFVDKTE